MMPDWMTYIVDAAVLVPVMVLFVRLAGLRAFSKMSAYDFAVTVSFGSILAATVVSPDTTLVQGIAAMGCLFAVQWIIGAARSRYSSIAKLTDNAPVLLMRDGTVIEENLAKSRVTMDDLRAKLREANVLDFGQVRAVVLETTGDVSVLHGDHLSDDLIEGLGS